VCVFHTVMYVGEDNQENRQGGACCLVSWRCFGAGGSLPRWSGRFAVLVEMGPGSRQYKVSRYNINRQVHAVLCLLLITFLCLPPLTTSIWNEFFLSPDLDKLDRFGHTRNRTAIIISGQLRSGNISFFSGDLKPTFGLTNMFGAADPPSSVQTQIEWLMKPLTEWGGIDVFMYVEAHAEDSSNVWDGNPAIFKPRIGDTTACEIYSYHPIFHNGTGNRFFCLVEEEVSLINTFVANFSTWTRYSYGNRTGMVEQALRQYYGMYRANHACKQFAAANNVHYTYKIRLRPDTALVKPFPKWSDFRFRDTSPNCRKHIYYASKRIYNNGNEDWFNVGLAEDMDHILDRYIDFTTEIFYWTKPGKIYFDLEDHLVVTMASKHHTCMSDYPEIWMVVIRVNGHALNKWRPKPIENDWKEMSTFSFV
jgi:hypothetical protein